MRLSLPIGMSVERDDPRTTFRIRGQYGGRGAYAVVTVSTERVERRGDAPDAFFVAAERGIEHARALSGDGRALWVVEVGYTYADTTENAVQTAACMAALTAFGVDGYRPAFDGERWIVG